MISFDRQILDQYGKFEIENRSDPTVRLTAVGDMAFNGKILEAMEEHSPEFILENVSERINLADLAIGNLESVLVPFPYSPLSSKACLISGLKALDALKSSGFNIMTFANNHIFDGGPEGVLTTLSGLKNAGLHYAGAGPTRDEARVPATVVAGGLTFKVFAYCYGQGQIAGDQLPGCNEARLDNILRDVDEFSTSSDIRVVSLHMDAEFQATPAPDRIAMCRKLADQGVQIVICHHPHVPQGIEIHGRSIIAYSLGNYVFPMMPYMIENSPDCALSFHLELEIELEIDRNGPVRGEVVPVQIDDFGRPIPATGDEKSRILDLISERSAYLHDSDEVSRRYQAMVQKFSSTTFKNIYWAVGERDWSRLRTIFRGLRSTPTKRNWIRHYLAGKLTGR